MKLASWIALCASLGFSLGLLLDSFTVPLSECEKDKIEQAKRLLEICDARPDARD